MIIDLHVHTSRFSSCSHMTLEEALLAGKSKGLDALCFTEHDVFPDRNEISLYSKKIGLPVFVGVEIHTLDGDILVFGTDKLPKPFISAQTLINETMSKGGICLAAHPFRDNALGVGTLLDTLKNLNGVEVYNGNTKSIHNELAYEYANKLQLAAVGGSDAHITEQVGIFATYFEDEINSVDDLVKAVKAKRVAPVMYENNKYLKL